MPKRVCRARDYLIEQEELERGQGAEKEAKKANQVAKKEAKEAEKRLGKKKERQSRLHAS